MNQKKGKKSYRRVLTIAGSDSGGGAGIQADLKTISALGCYGCSVVTALTAQNTQTVTAVHEIPEQFIQKQFFAVAEDIGFDAIKVGMLHKQSVAEAIKESLLTVPTIPLVIDPVMISTTNIELIDMSSLDYLLRHLLPLATLVTPNIPEAEKLLNIEINNKNTMEWAAKELAKTIGASVLLKGGHLDAEECCDCFYDIEEHASYWYCNLRIETKNTHGTGCSLSSAIASYLAKGESLVASVGAAIDYLHSAIVAGKDYSIGQGHGPVHHHFSYW